MSKTKNANHKYLLSLYDRVDDFLTNDIIVQEELPDAIVSFCIVVEKTLKLKLHDKNPFLVFDLSNLKADGALEAVVMKKEEDISTARIHIILGRFKILFNKVFTEDEIVALLDIYEVRNCFMHGYKSDDKISFNPEDIVRKMGTVWEKVFKIALPLFSKQDIKSSKPKKKYTEKELEEVLEEEVKKMIKPIRGRSGMNSVRDLVDIGNTSTSLWRSEKCPRCGAHNFSLEIDKNEWGTINDWSESMFTATTSWIDKSGLYKCKRCNLELTEKQYEIAKRLGRL